MYYLYHCRVSPHSPTSVLRRIGFGRPGRIMAGDMLFSVHQAWGYFPGFPEPSHFLECFLPPNMWEPFYDRQRHREKLLSVIRWNCSPIPLEYSLKIRGLCFIHCFVPRTSSSAWHIWINMYGMIGLQHYEPHKYLHAFVWTSDLTGGKRI